MFIFYRETQYFANMETWRQNYVIGSKEYLIFMFLEWLIPHKHTLKFLCKSVFGRSVDRLTVCELLAFKLQYIGLLWPWNGFRVSQGHRKRHDRAHTTLYSFSIVNYALSITVSELIAAYWSKIAIPPCVRRPRWPLGARSRQIYATTLGDENLHVEWWAYQAIRPWKNFDGTFSRLIQSTRMTDGQTDGSIGLYGAQHSVAR